MNFPSVDKKSWWILVLGILVTALFLYFPNPHMGYVLDDHYVIDRNPVVKHSTIARIFGSGLFDAAHRKTDSNLNYYRPLLTASFAIEYSLWGSNPFAQRLVNLLIHVLNCVLVFVLLYLLFGNVNRAGLAAILFCILPVHEWSVRYIVGRGDLMSGFFCLASLVACVLYFRKNSRGWMWTAVAAFAMALLSKESALVHVAYVFLVTLFVSRSLAAAVRITVFFVIIAAAYYLLRLEYFPISIAGRIESHNLIYAIWLGLGHVCSLWFPALFRVISTLISDGALDGLIYVSALAWFFVSLWFLYSGVRTSVDRLRTWLLGSAWVAFGFVQFMAVESVLDRLGFELSGHFLYFMSIGMTLVLTVMIEAIRAPFLRKTVLVFYIFFYLAISLFNGRYWVNEEILLRHVSRLEGGAYTVAYEQLVMRYVDDENAVLGLIKRAPTASTKSVWYRRLGDMYHKYRHYPKAKEALKRAVELNPRNTEALNQWAVCFLETGAPQEGLELLTRSILVDPNQSDAYRLTGIYYYRNQQYQDAIVNLNKAVALNPEDSESALHVMMAYYFVNDQNAYMQMIDTLHAIDQGMMLRFAAREFFNHGFYTQTIAVIEQSKRLFANDPAMMALAEAARGKTLSLPK